MSEASATPEWFSRAIGTPSVSRRVEIDGASIHYLMWNEAEVDKPGLLFAHGFRAHARWWSFIAPFFLSRFRVAALDFAGMGDSAARARYTPLAFSQDVIGVLKDAQLERATLVGHSFGGGRILRACAEYPDGIERAVVIDSYINLAGAARHGGAFELKPKKTYRCFNEALARFRLVPGRSCAAPYVLDFIARHSLKPVAGGWTWKFDDSFSPTSDDANGAQILARIDTPVTFVYGEASEVVSREQADELMRHLRNGRGPVVIPGAHHHVLLDQPLTLIAALREILL